MSKDILFSILIPVYNAAFYIEECLVSIKNQSYKNFECIIINDGSTDNSLKLINKVVSKDLRFRVISQTNSGVANTRNRLLDRASGKYIVWIDADDFVDINLLSIIAHEIRRKEEDVYCFGYSYFENNIDEAKRINLFNKRTLLSSKTAFKYLAKEFTMRSFLWNKVIKRNLYTKLRFSVDKKMLEDYEIVTKLFLKMKNMVYIGECLYFYRQTSGSITHNITCKMIHDNNLTIKERENFILKAYPELLNSINVGRAYRALSYFTFIRKPYNNSVADRKEQTVLRKYFTPFLLDKDIPIKHKFAASAIVVNLKLYDLLWRLYSK